VSTQQKSYSFNFVGGLVFAFFIAVKLAGTSLAAWSWWWLLFPLVPVLALLVQRVGL
jgi:fatty acid desaturase